MAENSYKSFRVIGAVAACVLLAHCAASRADSFVVPLQNPSFDDQSLGDGSVVDVGGIDRWLGSGAQIVNWAEASFTNAGDGSSTGGSLPSPASGRNSAFVQYGTSNSIYQDAVLLQPDTTYTLTAAFGDRKDQTMTQGGTLELINGIDSSGTLLASQAVTFAPSDVDTFKNATVSFTTGSQVSGHLAVAVASSPQSQAVVDNFSLTAASTNAASRQQISIMPLGDSITAGAQDPVAFSADVGSGYRDRLYQDLSSVGASFKMVGDQTTKMSPMMAAAGPNYYYHEGVGSQTISQVQGYASGYLDISGTKPSYVLLMAGTNDAQYGHSVSSMEADMTNLLNWLRQNQPDTKVIVATVLPFGPAKTGYDTLNAGTIVPFDNWLRSEVGSGKAFDGNFSLVDMYNLFVNPDGTVKTNTSADGIFLGDGIHPSHEGYVAMGDQWYNAIEQSSAVPEPASLALLGAGAALVLLKRRSLAGFQDRAAR